MSKQPDARWYVYTLVDPRDGAIFYVGKGTGSRVHQHEREAAKPETVCSKKINKIKDIWAAGKEVGKEFNAFFWDEQAAYDHETDLIEEIGLASLTNVLPGGQKAWERRQVERASRKEKDPEPMHVWLARRGETIEALYQRFSEWLKAGLHKGGREVRFTAADPRFKINAIVSEVVYNTMLPMMWKKIVNDEASRKVFTERIRRYGVEIV